MTTTEQVKKALEEAGIKIINPNKKFEEVNQTAEIEIEYLYAFLIDQQISISLLELSHTIKELFNENGIGGGRGSWKYTIVLEKGFESFQAIRLYLNAAFLGYAPNDLTGVKAKKQRQTEQLEQVDKLFGYISNLGGCLKEFLKQQ
ncbi:hypothetical protein [Aureispira sp. CCB-QB1]|uniref:hypothetical protein n=1 Tax=Aureispira sp. CCB-QB1 TaxID=1313421 RepID=UPI0006984541|nr:hypothetical protein [Aureispira sp. CCB-QB1]